MRTRRLLLILLLFAAPPMLAAPITIDFTDGAFAGAAGVGSFTTTIFGITVQLTALPPGATLTWPNADPDGFKDGIGIDWNYEDDEVESSERLVVTLTAPPYPMRWLKIHLTDLFYEGSPRYREQGAISPDGGTTWDWFWADTTQLPYPASHGLRTLDVSGDPDYVTNSVVFKAPGLINCQNHEYSVRAVELDLVPEPGGALLVLGGLVVLGACLRRRKARQSA